MASAEELVRLAALRQLDPLAATGDPVLERIARLATALTGAAFAGLHIIDELEQHRIASVGAPLDHWPRPDSMCRLVVEGEGGTGGIETADASLDPRFAYTSFVAGDEPVRYYAASPLLVGEAAIGTVCAWDTVARPPTDGVRSALADLAALAVDHLEALRSARILAEAAVTDPLTGLANRRMVLDAIVRATSLLERDGAPATVAFVDLDGFKAVNDALGHDVGDEVLVAVGHRLRAVVRAHELVARVGGDEFVLVLGSGAEETAMAIERLVAEVSRPVSTVAGEVVVGASVGLAPLAPGTSPDAVLRRADLAMYADKAIRRGSLPGVLRP